MPRQAQLDIPGAPHHIMVRGINKADIFDDDQDKTRFLERYRAVIALRGRDELGLWAVEIARQVGMNTSGVTKAIERAKQHYEISQIETTSLSSHYPPTEASPPTPCRF